MVNMYVVAGVVLILILLALWFLYEPFCNKPFYADQIAMKHPDPTWMFYNGRAKDIQDMDMRDYYLMNQILEDQGVYQFPDDQYLSRFYNNDRYMGIDEPYRPDSKIVNTEISHRH